ncbi:hypothetical protein LJR153_007229 [Paenibacillus sp. LjRoot153]|uniref:hypothetical protein n=1 Tax=Paenibacillus sp. LjRoot153 TaxID=3342270 RepID=UPI003ED15982
MSEKEDNEIQHLVSALLNDNQISFKAKGLFFNIIFSYAEMELTMEILKKMSQIDSERSIKLGLTELEKAGYLNRKTLQNGVLSWEYNIQQNVKDNKKQKVKTTTSNETIKPIRKKLQTKKKTRNRKTTQKSGFNRALSNFFKEFF